MSFFLPFFPTLTYYTCVAALGGSKLFCLTSFRHIGYSDYQVYLLLSCAPIQGHVGGLVDIPNACMTLGLPMDIFDFDISPATTATRAAGGAPVVEKMDMGACAVASK